MEDGVPVLDLNTNNNYRYNLPNNESNNFRLNCGTDDWLMQFTIAIDPDISYENNDIMCMVGLAVSTSYPNYKTQLAIALSESYTPHIQVYSSSENIWRNIDNIAYEYIIDYTQYHRYTILKHQDEIKLWVDNKYIGNMNLTENFIFDFSGTIAPGFLYRRVTVGSIPSQIFNGKVKSFDWYKGDLGSFVTTNLKLGD